MMRKFKNVGKSIVKSLIKKGFTVEHIAKIVGDKEVYIEKLLNGESHMNVSKVELYRSKGLVRDDMLRDFAVTRDEVNMEVIDAFYGKEVPEVTLLDYILIRQTGVDSADRVKVSQLDLLEDSDDLIASRMRGLFRYPLREGECGRGKGELQYSNEKFLEEFRLRLSGPFELREKPRPDWIRHPDEIQSDRTVLRFCMLLLAVFTKEVAGSSAWNSGGIEVVAKDFNFLNMERGSEYLSNMLNKLYAFHPKFRSATMIGLNDLLDVVGKMDVDAKEVMPFKYVLDQKAKIARMVINEVRSESCMSYHPLYQAIVRFMMHIHDDIGEWQRAASGLSPEVYKELIDNVKRTAHFANHPLMNENTSKVRQKL